MPVQLKASPTVSKTRLQYANWIGHTTSMLIIVDNDIYIRQSPTDEEDVRLTFTGQPDIFYNGFSDWLYQGKQFSIKIHFHFKSTCFLLLSKPTCYTIDCFLLINC